MDPSQHLLDVDPTSHISLLEHKRILNETNAESNRYATTKSVSQNMLNISIIQSMIILIVNTLSKPLNMFAKSLVILACCNIGLQFLVFILLVILARTKEEQIVFGITATGLNDVITILSGIILIVTGSITAISSKTINP